MNSKFILIFGVLIILLLGVMAFSTFSPERNAAGNKGKGDAEIKLQVNIPCPGHAGIIIGNLQKVDGVESVDFELPNYFTVSYNSNKTSSEEITSINIFKDYPARIV